MLLLARWKSKAAGAARPDAGTIARAAFRQGMICNLTNPTTLACHAGRPAAVRRSF